MDTEKTVPLSVVMDLYQYLQHDSWRCEHYQNCHCGLNDLLEENGLPLLPIPNNDTVK